MKIGLDYRAALTEALNGALAAEAAASRAARRAEAAFEAARAGGGDVQAAAERFRAAHGVHMETRSEVAEIEAALEEDGLLPEQLEELLAA